jgi:hypothetical protein
MSSRASAILSEIERLESLKGSTISKLSTQSIKLKEEREERKKKQIEELERQKKELEAQQAKIMEENDENDDYVERIKYCFKILIDVIENTGKQKFILEGYDKNGQFDKEEKDLIDILFNSFSKPCYNYDIKSVIMKYYIQSLAMEDVYNNIKELGKSKCIINKLNGSYDSRIVPLQKFNYQPCYQLYLMEKHKTMRPHIEFKKRPEHKYMVSKILLDMLVKLVDKYYILGIIKMEKLEFIEMSIKENLI